MPELNRFGMLHALFLIVIPVGILLILTAGDIVRLMDSVFGITIRIGDIIIVYVLASVLIGRYGYRNSMRRKRKTKLFSD